MANATRIPTAAALYGFEDTVLDDEDVQTLSRAAEAAFRAARDAEKRSRALAVRTAARKSTIDYVPVPDAIQTFLAANPAF